MNIAAYVPKRLALVIVVVAVETFGIHLDLEPIRNHEQVLAGNNSLICKMSTGTRYGQDYYLTPRTPRSRVSQSFNRQHDERNEVDYQQAEPLLRSSASDTFEGSGQQIQVRPISLELPPSPRKRGKKGSTQLLTTLTPWLSKAPLILGLIGALLLLGLFILSLQQPETLQKYILENPPTQNVEKVDGMPDFIDYSNYTDFPLEPSEYEEECWLIQEKMKSHPDYWDGMVVDVPHESPPGADGVCSSSITYMLDGSVGLAFDLALIAQVAALAREVSVWRLTINVVTKFFAAKENLYN